MATTGIVRRAPRVPPAARSLAVASGCGIDNAVVISGRRSFDAIQPDDEVVLLTKARVVQLIPGTREILINGGSGNRRVSREEIARHVEITK